MSETTDQLIARLSADAAPVRRLRAPVWRAAAWLAAAAIAAAAGIAVAADPALFETRLAQPTAQIEMLSALVTGVVAVLAAFHLSVPDRSPAWMLAPLPALVVWIGSSGYGCYELLTRNAAGAWAPGSAVDCLRFILATSVPLAVALLPVLRRARPLAPAPVAAMAGLGVAALAACLLEFFHPVDVTVLDLAAHVAAVAAVVGVSALAGKGRLLRPA